MKVRRKEDVIKPLGKGKSGTIKYASANWEVCATCKIKATGHKSGQCIECRKKNASNA